MRYPLDGLKVVNLAAYIAGAYSASLLADMGAQVVKVESHAGDGFRLIGSAFQGWNRGMRAMVLDKKVQEGRDILYVLVADADVVVENYRPGVAKRLGADYDTLGAINPKIVYCSVTGYGLSGPQSEGPVFDPLLQAMSGAMVAQDGEGSSPVFLRVPVSDYAAAMLAAYGIATALVHRARSGRGQRLETSLLNAVVAVQAAEFFAYPGMPESPRFSRFGTSSTYRLYEAADGWLFLSCSDDESWSRACGALGCEDLAEKYPDRTARAEHDAEIGTALETVFARDTRQRWLSALRASAVRCSSSNNGVDVHADPQAIHMGLTVDAESPDVGPTKQMGLPVRFSRTPAKVWGPSPAHGQHTEEVLAELGFSSQDIAGLKERRVIG